MWGAKLFDEEGEAYGRHGQRQKKIYISIFGKVEVERTGYYTHGRPLFFPLDAEANLPKRRFSYPLQELVNDFGMNGPFRDAMERLKKWRREGVWDHSAEQISRESATDYESFYATKPAPELAPPEEYLVVGVDGKGVPMSKRESAKIQGKLDKGQKRQKKKEALVGVCFTIAPKARTAEEVAENLVYPDQARERRKAAGEKTEDAVKPRDARRLASLEPKDQVAAELVQEAEKRDPKHERALVLLMDGDDGLRRLAGRSFVAWPKSQVFYVLDIIKVVQYLWQAAHVFCCEGSKEAAAFVHKRLVKILQGKVGYVIGGLQSSLTKRGLRGRKAKAVSDVIRYFDNHADMMRYDVYLAYGFPISTSCVESLCKALVKHRMEGSGMRWSVEGAEAMLRLRSVLMSSDWDAYWEHRIANERERRHGKTLGMLRHLDRRPALRPTG